MTTENSEEFIVCHSKVEYIDSNKSKIERLFGTRVYFTEISRVDDKEKRWVKVTGGKWDRQNAKTYILGLSEPEETKTVPCLADFIDAEVLENIEKTTQAVLTKPSENVVQISGNELAVTLALSSIEELTGTGEDVVDGASAAGTASQRLDEKLNETFESQNSSLSKYPPTIKRVFLECGRHEGDDNDIHEDLLHGDGREVDLSRTRKISSEVIARAQPERDPRKNVTAPICQRKVVESDVIVDSVDHSMGGAGVATVTEQFRGAAQITPTKQSSVKGIGETADSLREFAKGLHYTDEDIDEAFLYTKPPMKPTDFLSCLKKIKEGKIRLGIDSVDRRQEQRESHHGHGNASKMEEDDIMIIEDHFSPREKSPNKTGGLSKKDKKKNENRQNNLDQEFKKQEGKKNSPKNANSSGTKRKSDPDSDNEQTCVMKVWDSAPELPERMAPIPPRQQRMLVNDAPMEQAQARTGLPVSTHNPLDPRKRSPEVTHNPRDPRKRSPEVYPPAQPLRINNNQSNTGNISRFPAQAPAPCPRAMPDRTEDLRWVIVDGSNVAMFHGNNKVFSCKGIQIAVDYFLDRGHKVTVFVPEWRKYRSYHDNRIKDQEILQKLEDSENLVFTPSRKIQGKLVASYDDRFILSLAEKEDSVILSNDQYRDLMREKASWKKIVEERLLMYRFVGDHFMPAEDPLGRNGPMLDEFLRKQPRVAQTFANNFPYPGQPIIPGHYQPQADFHSRPVQHMPQNIPGRVQRMPQQRFPVGHWQADGHSPQGQGPWQPQGRQPMQIPNLPQKQEPPKRHENVTKELLTQLKGVFSEPNQEEKLKRVLDNHSSETDLNRLTNYCMEVIFEQA